MTQQHGPSPASGAARDAVILPGKLPGPLLSRLLSTVRHHDARLLNGPGVGLDAAFISFGASTLIAKTDPVTFATDLAGWYAVQVNANDIAVSGGEPKWFLATVLLPEGATAGLAEDIFNQVRDAAGALGVELAGGHTEVTTGLSRPIVVGLMLGEAEADSTYSASGARPGDAIVLTQGIAIEGTALLAREAAPRLSAAGVPGTVIERARQLLFDPGISVLEAARTVRRTGGATGMHDPTEGGIATALAEVAAASGCGVEVDEAAVSVLPETAEVCRALGADPWGLIASGALIATVGPDRVGRTVEALRSAGIPTAVIGRMTPASDGLTVTGNAGRSPLRQFARDEVARLLG